MADIRKAFLMIKLKSEVDMNRFCCFVREGKNVVCNNYFWICGQFIHFEFFDSISLE